MATTSLSHILEYPAFSVDWVDAARLVVTGGGGASKTGIPNGVTLYMVRHGVERLVKLRFHSTGDQLPYMGKADARLDLLALAVGRRVELLRLHDLKPLATVLDRGGEAAQQAAAEGKRVEDLPDPAMAAAFSPDGKLLALAGEDGRLRVLRLRLEYEEEPDKEKRRRGVKGPLRAVAVVGSAVEPLDAAAGKPYRELAFHPSGRSLLGSGEDGSWRLWHVLLEEEERQQQQQQQQAQQAQAPPTSPRPPPPPTPGPAAAAAASVNLVLRPALRLPAVSGGLGRCYGARNRDEAVVQAVGKDAKEGVLFTCRCGKFALGGRAAFTVHFARRGPRNADKRPYLTRWEVAVDPATGLVQVMEPTKSIPVGESPLMCLALHPDGGAAAAGDCVGSTVHFRTADLGGLRARAGMHNFGVTGIAFSPSPAPPGGGASSGPPLRIASSSGDKTLRLQYADPAQAAAFLATAAAPPATHQTKPRGAVARFIGGLCGLLWYATLALGLLVLWSMYLARAYDVPLDLALDRLALGRYEPAAWEPVAAQAQEAMARAAPAVRRAGEGVKAVYATVKQAAADRGVDFEQLEVHAEGLLRRLQQ